MRRVFFGCFICVFLWSCSKQTETLQIPDIHDYLPVPIGRVLIYRLDSTVTPPFGTSLVVRSYLAKDSIESEFQDNLGRPSYRVFRYTTDTLQQGAWQYADTYYITPTSTTIEVNENNMRFIKLAAPVSSDNTWKGNAFIETQSATSPVRYLDGWDYTYQDILQPYTVAKGTLDSTITVFQQDDTSPEGPFDPNSYQQRNYSIEVYAKGIGLVYKDFLHWTWQTDPPPAAYDDDSYGIRLSLIDYR